MLKVIESIVTLEERKYKTGLEFCNPHSWLQCVETYIGETKGVFGCKENLPKKSVFLEN